MTVYLCLDYGRVHVGIAFADHLLATPLPPLKNDTQLISQLSLLISKYHITHLVLGLPTGPLETEVRNFADILKRELGLTVTLHDETLSSHDAVRQLIAVGAGRAKKRNEHSYAAALILEDYLESVKLG